MTEIKPEDRISGVLQRTRYNLDFIDDRAGSSGPFEVIQLINSFMGAAVHPWENLLEQENELVNLSAREVFWPNLEKARPDDDEPFDFHEQMAWIRQAFALGNIDYLNADGSIIGIEIRNHGYSRKQKRRITWGTRLDLQQLRQLLDSYCEIAVRIDRHTRAKQPTANDEKGNPPHQPLADTA